VLFADVTESKRFRSATWQATLGCVSGLMQGDKTDRIMAGQNHAGQFSPTLLQAAIAPLTSRRVVATRNPCKP